MKRLLVDYDDSREKLISSFVSDKETANESKKLFAVAVRVHDKKLDLLKPLPSFKKMLYIEQPEKDFSFSGYGAAIDAGSNGTTSFVELNKRISSGVPGLINNFDDYSHVEFPVVLGGMKFNINTGGGTSEWDEFHDSEWFIPEFLILNTKGEQYVVHYFNDLNDHDRFRNFVLMHDSESTGKASSRAEGSKNKFSKTDKQKNKVDWIELVHRGIDEIGKGVSSKIVLSRREEIAVSLDNNFDWVILKLREEYRQCTLFLFRSGDSYFFGASPERLASFTNGTVELDSLAGSSARGNTNEADEILRNELLTSSKIRNEHNYVTDYLVKESSEYVKSFSVPEPFVKTLTNIQHLYTPVKGKMLEPSMMFSLLDKIFPTPAVCGFPKDSSMKFILQNENYDRGMYSGTIGWFNMKYQGEFIAALRSALYRNDMLYAYAGCGIVESSDPVKEYSETELKLKPIISLLS